MPYGLAGVLTNMSEDNNRAIAYIVYISTFLVALYWFWDPYSVIEVVLVSCLIAFIGGGGIRVAIAVAFDGEGASEASVFKKVVTFFITLAVLYLIITAGSGGDSLHY